MCTTHYCHYKCKRITTKLITWRIVLRETLLSSELLTNQCIRDIPTNHTLCNCDVILVAVCVCVTNDSPWMRKNNFVMCKQIRSLFPTSQSGCPSDTCPDLQINHHWSRIVNTSTRANCVVVVVVVCKQSGLSARACICTRLFKNIRISNRSRLTGMKCIRLLLLHRLGLPFCQFVCF